MIRRETMMETKCTYTKLKEKAGNYPQTSETPTHITLLTEVEGEKVLII
jgi:hypothetical protein